MIVNLKKKIKGSALGWLWFSCGATASVTALTLSSAALPPSGRVTDDTAIYQNLSEIRAKRDHKPNFDSDISQLASMERSHRESGQSLKSGLDQSRRREAQKKAQLRARKQKLQRGQKNVAKRKDRVRTTQASPSSRLNMARVMSPLKRIEETKYIPSGRGSR